MGARRVVALAFLLALGLSACSSSRSPSAYDGPVVSPSPAVDPGSLPGIQDPPAPWAPELDHLGDRLAAIGLPALTVEGHAMDVHVVVAVFVEGNPVAVPSGIGLNGQEDSGTMLTGFVSPLHTHDASGLIHIHSPEVRPYWLGLVFDVWGVRFTRDCLGPYCTSGGEALRVFVNGDEVTGADPRNVELQQGDTIVVAFGTEQQLPDPIPSAFPAS